MATGNTRVELESCQLEKDLGVNVDADLKFRDHVDTQVGKANRLRSDQKNFRIARLCVPPCLVQVARPTSSRVRRFKGDHKSLERVQHRATRLIPHLSKLEYKHRLRVLKIPTLGARGDMIECYKDTSGIYRVPGGLLERDTESKTRGHSKKLNSVPLL